MKPQIISLRRVSGRTEESARKRSAILVKKHKFLITDELITNNVHMILANLSDEQIKNIGNSSIVNHVEDPPRISF